MPYKLNVPSNLIEFQDGGLVFRQTSQNVTSKSVLVIGFAQDGPLDPVAVDETTVATIFGKDVDENGVANGGTICTDVLDLVKAGCKDIRAMKIAGSASKAVVKTASTSIVESVRRDEVLGIVDGNDETTLVLNNTDVIENSIKIYTNDKLLPSAFEYDSAKNELTIPSGVCNANVPVTVKYNYNGSTKQSKTESLSVALNKVTLSKSPVAGTVTVYKNDTLIDPSKYTVSASSITFSDSEIADKDIVVVQYDTNVDVVKSATDKENAGVPYKTATSLQEFTLNTTPESGTFHLYCDDVEVSLANFVVVDKTLKIQKSNLGRGKALSCSYLETVSEDRASELLFESYFASSVYNLGKIEVANIVNKESKVIGKEVVIHKPDSKKANGEEPLRYSSLSYSTLGDLVNVINADLRNGVYLVSTDSPDELTVSLTVGVTNFEGGDSGMSFTKDEILECLAGERDDEGYIVKEGVFQLLEGYSVDYVYLSGVYADDVLSGKSTFDYELALFCAAISKNNKTVYGVIDTKPCKNTSLLGVKTHVDNLKNFNADGKRFLLKDNGKIYTNKDGKTIDLGQYIRICAGPEPWYLNSERGKHACRAGIAYLGLQTCIAAQSSPMNKALRNSKGLRHKYTVGQLTSLTNANLICFNSKIGEDGNYKLEAYVFDSMTQALPNSDFVSTVSCEVIGVVADDIREITDPYIGEPPTKEKLNAMASQLSKRFENRKTEGVAESISFELVQDTQALMVGDLKINVDVKVYGVLRTISTTIGLKPAGQ